MKTINILKATSGTLALLVCAACTGLKVDSQVANGQQGASSGVSIAKVNMSIVDASGNEVYSDTKSNSSLKLTAGAQYTLNLDASSNPSGTTYSLQSTETDIVSGSPVVIPLNPGANSFSVPAQGDYAWKLIITAQGQAPVAQNYQASVICSSPTFTADSLDPSKISVSGNTNLYSFSAAGVTANANGMAPYLCAWDPTGTGIVDSAFQPCSQVLANYYVTYVDQRYVGLIVKDSCNISYSINNTAELNYVEPSMPGNVFIFGQTSGIAEQRDGRVDNVTYLATNVSGHNIVQPMYGNGSFSISSLLNYEMPSSVQFGMQIKLKGLTDNLNAAAGTGSVDASKAYIDTLVYTTDQAGDSAPALSFTGTKANCVLSNQGTKAIPTVGTPCSSGQSGTNNMISVEVWGHYVCTNMSNATRTISIEGDFDGTYNLVDSCVGGGGSTGGIVPIQL